MPSVFFSMLQPAAALIPQELAQLPAPTPIEPGIVEVRGHVTLTVSLR